MNSKLKIRRGITLIEVLSAIAVASIGVFGVLVLVPLASRLSQVGFSNEAARSNSTNVLAKAKSFGALDYSRWVYYDEGGSNLPPPPAGFAGLPRWRSPFVEDGSAKPLDAVCIDPLLLAPDKGILADRANRFPLTSLEPPVGTVGMPRVTINETRSLVPARVGSSFANSFVSESNSVRLNAAVADLAPPTQKYLDEPGVGHMMREVSSSKSSIVLMLPTGDDNQSGFGSMLYRAMAITIDGRSYSTLVEGANSFDRVFSVVAPNPVRTDYGLFDLQLSEYDFDAAGTGQNLPSGGWVVMVSVNPETGAAYWHTAKGYEIVSSDTNNGRDLEVTLVGPPFNAVSMMDSTDTLQQTLTHVIYVQGAVDIHEMEVRLGVE